MTSTATYFKAGSAGKAKQPSNGLVGVTFSDGSTAHVTEAHAADIKRRANTVYGKSGQVVPKSYRQTTATSPQNPASTAWQASDKKGNPGESIAPMC